MMRRAEIDDSWSRPMFFLLGIMGLLPVFSVIADSAPPRSDLKPCPGFDPGKAKAIIDGRHYKVAQG